jgi:hypothetical protein
MEIFLKGCFLRLKNILIFFILIFFLLLNSFKKKPFVNDFFQQRSDMAANQDAGKP